jgi:hypothetical protein
MSYSGAYVSRDRVHLGLMREDTIEAVSLQETVPSMSLSRPTVRAKERETVK